MTSSALDRYPHELAGHCASGSLRDLLALNGLDYGAGPLSEAMAFGLAGGLGFSYAHLQQPGPVGFYMIGRTGDLEEDFARHLQIPLQVLQSTDPAEGWAQLAERIDQGRPPVVWADIAHLDYLRVRMSNTRHAIVPVAYDLDEQVVWIADNDREELQRCALSSLATARQADGFPDSARNRLFDFTWPDRLPPAREAIRAAMQTAVGNMQADGPAIFGLADSHRGAAGVAAFAAELARWPDRFGADLEANLGALSVLIVKAGTGGALFRGLWAGFLTEAAALTDDAELRALGEHYEQTATTWVALADQAKQRRHLEAVGLADRLAELEATGLQQMTRWLQAPPTH